MGNIVFILIAVILNAMAQIVLRRGMMTKPDLMMDWESILYIITNVYIYIGLSLYIASFLVWIKVLSKTEVSFAYPFLSIGYILTAVIGYYAFNENLSFIRILGILVICVGVILISRS